MKRFFACLLAVMMVVSSVTVVSARESDRIELGLPDFTLSNVTVSNDQGVIPQQSFKFTEGGYIEKEITAGADGMYSFTMDTWCRDGLEAGGYITVDGVMADNVSITRTVIPDEKREVKTDKAYFYMSKGEHTLRFTAVNNSFTARNIVISYEPLAENDSANIDIAKNTETPLVINAETDGVYTICLSYTATEDGDMSINGETKVPVNRSTTGYKLRFDRYLAAGENTLNVKVDSSLHIYKISVTKKEPAVVIPAVFEAVRAENAYVAPIGNSISGEMMEAMYDIPADTTVSYKVIAPKSGTYFLRASYGATEDLDFNVTINTVPYDSLFSRSTQREIYSCTTNWTTIYLIEGENTIDLSFSKPASLFYIEVSDNEYLLAEEKEELVAKPLTVLTTVGEKPALPDSVVITDDAGNEVTKRVSWDRVFKEDVAKEGEFVVEGHIYQKKEKITAKVIVCDDVNAAQQQDYDFVTRIKTNRVRLVNNKPIDATVRVYNYTDEPSGAVALVALYEGNRLSKLSTGYVSVDAHNYADVSTGIEIGSGDLTGSYVKVMSWSDINKMTTNIAGKVITSEERGLPEFGVDPVEDIVAAMTDEEKAYMVTGRSSASKEHNAARLGIVDVVDRDGPGGINMSGYAYSTWFPSETNIARTWDADLAYTVGRAYGQQGTEFIPDIWLGPGMNIQRNPLNGRNFEYMSEDPVLTGKMISQYVKGASDEGLMPMLKHFAVNNQETLRGSINAVVTERALREIYLKGFEIAVTESPVKTVMSSYNMLNGLHTSESYDLLTGILRDEWGFDGFILSDYGAGGSPVDIVKAQGDIYNDQVNLPRMQERYDLILAAIKRGKGEEVPENAQVIADAGLPSTVADGEHMDIPEVGGGNNADATVITPEEIDRCCTNVLNTILNSQTFKNERRMGTADLTVGSTLGRMAAADSAVLLKNDDNTLPLAEGEVALFGNAQNHVYAGGKGSGHVDPAYVVSVSEGIENSGILTLNETVKAYYENCESAPEWPPSTQNNLDKIKFELPVNQSMANAAASESDYAIIVLNRTTSEGADHVAEEGDYKLNSTEQEMIETVSNAFHNAGKKVIVLLNMTNAIEMASWVDKVDAVLSIGYGGNETGNAAADVLTGKVTPAGKLTETIAKKYDDIPSSFNFPGNGTDVVYEEDLYVGYRYSETFPDVNQPLYEFGYGLSYTTFEYSEPEISSVTFDDETEEITVSVTVTNTGDTYAGREIVELYVGKPEVTLEQPSKQLIAFAKTKTLAPGESETVTMTFNKTDVKSYDEETSDWIMEAGEYKLFIGASVKDIRENLSFNVPEKIVVQDVENRCVPQGEINIVSKKNPPVTGKNFALGKRAVTNAEEYNAGAGKNLVAADAVDGDRETRWSGFIGENSTKDGNTEDAWLYVDLGQNVDISNIVIYWNGLQNTYDIDVWNGTDWVTIVDESTAGGKAVFRFTDEPVTARFVRVIGRKYGWFSITELEVYGEESENMTEPENYPITFAENMALNKRVVSNAEEYNTTEGMLTGAKAVDGLIGTRWSGCLGEDVPGKDGSTTDAWLYVDLEKNIDVSKIILRWQVAKAPYVIEVWNSETEAWDVINDVDPAIEGNAEFTYNQGEVTARYIRVRGSKNAWISMYEFEVYGEVSANQENLQGPPQYFTENLALGKTAVANAQENDCAPANATDGAMGTRWSGFVGGAGDAWIYVDLGGKANIDEIVIQWDSINGEDTYKVEVSNDPNGEWTLLEEVSIGGQIMGTVADFTFEEAVTARYVRVRARKDHWFSIKELEVYGSWSAN